MENHKELMEAFNLKLGELCKDFIEESLASHKYEGFSVVYGVVRCCLTNKEREVYKECFGLLKEAYEEELSRRPPYVDDDDDGDFYII